MMTKISFSVRNKNLLRIEWGGSTPPNARICNRFYKDLLNGKTFFCKSYSKTNGYITLEFLEYPEIYLTIDYHSPRPLPVLINIHEFLYPGEILKASNGKEVEILKFYKNIGFRCKKLDKSYWLGFEELMNLELIKPNLRYRRPRRNDLS